MAEPVDTNESPATDARSTDLATPSHSTADLWEAVGKLVLPLTIACYVLGFLGAMPHFAKAGVPIDAISPQRFLAAGVLFLVITATLAPCGASLRRAITAPKGRRRLLWRRFFLDFPAPFGFLLWFLTAHPNALLFALAYGVLGIFLSFLLVHDFGLPSRAEGASGMVRDLLTIVFFGLMLVAAFSFLVYPHVAVTYGGGLPDPIVMTGTGLTNVAQDTWALVGCRGESLPAPSCRAVYRIYENSSHLYIAAVELPGACPPKAPEWDLWRAVPSRRGCYQSISKDQIPRLESAGVP